MAAVDCFYLLYREISRSCSSYVEALALIGAWYTVRKCMTLAFNTYSILRLHVVPKLVGEIDLVKRYGRWAVVTGKRLKQRVCLCLYNVLYQSCKNLLAYITGWALWHKLGPVLLTWVGEYKLICLSSDTVVSHGQQYLYSALVNSGPQLTDCWKRIPEIVSSTPGMCKGAWDSISNLRERCSQHIFAMGFSHVLKFFSKV